jgi:drug/metabolite transporter (DMT)-like permease
MSVGYIFAFGACIGWSIAGFIITNATKQLPVPVINLLRLAFGVSFITILTLAFNFQDFTHLFSSNFVQAWLWLGLSGIISLVLGDHLSFKSYAILKPQKASIVTTLSPTTALIFGILLLNEKINIVGIVGIIITILGVISISLGRSQRNAIHTDTTGNTNKAILFGLAAAACHGLGLALSKKGLMLQKEAGDIVSPINATFIRLIVGFLFLFMLTLFNGKIKMYYQQIIANKSASKQTFLGSIFNPTLAVTLSMFSILYMDVAVAQTIFSLVPFFTLLIAFFVLREKVTMQSLIGVLVAIAGVGILIWRLKISAVLGW